MELLARRPHFRRQLAAKLARRGYPEAEIEQALERLTLQGYLDDAAAARGFAAGRLARGGGEGRARLAAELRARGAEEEAIAAALADLPGDELPAALAAAARFLARGGRDAAALARHLARKGFPPHAIVAVLKDRPDGSPERSLESDPESAPSAPESPTESDPEFDPES